MYKVYQVENGDTIDIIANKVGSLPSEIISINGLTGEVYEGQLIVVPENNNLFSKYIVKKGDNLYEISRMYNVSLDTMLKINGLDKDDFIYPNQELLVPNNANIYVTQENDTLSGVANKLDVDINSLISENREIFLLPDQIIVKYK
ncbi:MAG: LysM peptidoglycan-binding domain-containing protein [Firmicutes bacterium]|nr:LysM peptidoglycan-binding domain-containing protein [Bacillota bacterium]